MTETNKQQILIVGCGVFGLSTALHLSSTPELRSKYQVTAIDAHSIPSPLSAATDYNKIIRAEYADFFYSKLSVEALKLWEDDPMYSEEFVQCGRFTLTPKGAAKRAQYEKQGLDNLKKLGYDVNSGIKRIESGKELAETVPEFKDNQFGDDIKGVYNPKAGYGRAARSLVAVYKQCIKQGVVFHFGDDGDAIEILRSSVNGSESVKVQSGKVYNADKIMVCTGASTGKLLDLSTQVKTLGLFVTHIKLTPEEYTKYHNMPIFFSSELGYFFPPDPETLELKIALTYSDTSNKVSDPHNDGKFITLPSYKINNPEYTFLAIDEPKVRHVLRQTIPSLANHQLHDSKICWISDTPKSHFVIDKVPGMKNVFVSTGDAGHAYKFLPNIGKYIKQLLIDGEWETGSELHSKWGWKYGKEAEFPAQFETRAKRLHFDLKDINEIQGGWFEEKEKAELNSKL